MSKETVKRQAKPKAQPQVADVELDGSEDRRGQVYETEGGKTDLPLIVIEKQDAMGIFSKESVIMPILKSIEVSALKIAPDISTAKGRKDIASVAYRVAQAKTYIDGVGKELVDELKALPKTIDANRKLAREFLDNLRDEVRKPLTQWEAEEERKAAEIKAAAEAKALAEQIERDHEFGLLMNAEFDRQREAEKQAKIAREAEEKARIEREAKERAEREAAQRFEAEQQAARQAVLDAEERVRKAEEEKATAIAQAKRDAEQAVLQEQQRAAAAEEERAKAAREAAKAEAQRQADKNHRADVNTKALNDLVEEAGLITAQAKAVVIAIAKGLISGVSIHY